MNKLTAEPFVDAKSIAEVLGLSSKRVYAMARAGILPATRLGPRTLRFRLTEVLAALDGLRARAPEHPNPGSRGPQGQRRGARGRRGAGTIRRARSGGLSSAQRIDRIRSGGH